MRPSWSLPLPWPQRWSLRALLPRSLRGGPAPVLASPLLLIFVSANLANLGNLIFNLVFSRWMGPQVFGQLALVVTVFLAVMGLFGALQLAVSQQIAREAGRAGGIAAALPGMIGRMMRGGLVLAPIGAGLVLLTGDPAGVGGALALLVLCLPFALGLSLARGVAMGRTEARGIVLSGQVEMWTRLIGAMIAWQLGLGLAGVAGAIGLSVATGWLALRGGPGVAAAAAKTTTGAEAAGGALDFGPLRGVILASLPFAGLQLGQVLLMDGDLLIAPWLADPTAPLAGQLAALGLFQRIQFFACFSLALLLLPRVTTAVTEGRAPLPAALPVLGIFLGVSGVLLLVALLSPEEAVQRLVGAAFLPAAAQLPLAALTAAVVTLNFLLATYLAALEDRGGIKAILATCPVQMLVIWVCPPTLAGIVLAKLTCQIALGLWLARRSLRRSLPSPRLEPQLS